MASFWCSMAACSATSHRLLWSIVPTSCRGWFERAQSRGPSSGGPQAAWPRRFYPGCCHPERSEGDHPELENVGVTNNVGRRVGQHRGALMTAVIPADIG